MTSTKIIIFLVLLCFAYLHSHSHHKIYHRSQLIDLLKSSSDFFDSQNEKAQTVVNTIFDLLDLTENIFKEPNFKLLLIMHNDLNNLLKNNFELFDVLGNVSVVEFDNTPANVIRLDETISEILHEKKFNVYNKIAEKEYKNIHNTRSAKRPLSEFDNSKEFKQFIGGFIGKVKSLDLDDIFKQTESEGSSAWSHTQVDLKVWVPPTAQNVDLYNNDTTNRRLFGGKLTNIAAFPYVVSIHIHDRFVCSGSIIRRNFVITAASCLHIHHNNNFFSENPRKTYVRLGSDWTTRQGDLVPVLQIHFFPHYEPRTLNHNLAIVRFEEAHSKQAHDKIELKRILVDHGEDLPTGAKIGTIGWGRRRPSQIVSQFEKLIYATLNVQDINECKNTYKTSLITRNNFCAGFESKNIGACNRDVGGPGFMGNLLVGIISFGSPICGAANTPMVFTRLANYITWIEYVMAKRPPQHGDNIVPNNITLDQTHNMAGPIALPKEDTQENPDEIVNLSETNDESKDKMIYDIGTSEDKDTFNSENKKNPTRYTLVNKTEIFNGLDTSLNRYTTRRSFWSKFLMAASKTRKIDGISQTEGSTAKKYEYDE